VTLAYLPQAIRSYLGDGSSLGVRLSYSVEDTPLGTAGSVRKAADVLDDTFVVISGDALCDIDLTALVAFHRERGAVATLAVKSVDNPLEFGVVIADEEGRVERFLEKPGWGQVFSDTINTGVYVLEPEVLRHVPAGEPYDFSKQLFPYLLESGRPVFAWTVPRGAVLAGHREPGPVPAGQSRRPRRAGPSGHPGRPAAGEHLAGRGSRRAGPRPDRGARRDRAVLQHRVGARIGPYTVWARTSS
jgi:hypothetical protein